MTGKKETVWDRLSKIKKVSSSEKVSEVRSLRPHLITKTNQSSHSNDHTFLAQSKQAAQRPMISKNSSVKQHLSDFQKKIVKKPEIVHKVVNETLLDDTPFEEIATSRSLSSDSKYSSDCNIDVFQFPAENKESLYCRGDRQSGEFSEVSIEEYTLAPLLASCSEVPIQGNVEKCLRCNNEDDDLSIDGVKSDSRNGISIDNPRHIKDIFKTQLEKLVIKEFAVEKSSHTLESSDVQERTNNIIEYSDHKRKVQKFEVGVVFKNVPTLDKEIEILRALGEKLEATLQNTNIHGSRKSTTSQRLVDSTTKPCEVLEQNKSLLLLKVKHDFKIEHFALVTIDLEGIRQCICIVREFFVTQKSIVELKREKSRPFFIPIESEHLQLVNTSFENLKKHPNELFRHVKPKNSHLTFNILEQDPVFFYNAIGKPSKISNFSVKNRNPNNAHLLSTAQEKDTYFGAIPNHEAAPNSTNSLPGTNAPKIMASCPSKFKKISTLNSNFRQAQANVEPTFRGARRKYRRRLITPMPIDYYHCPKNPVIKTILVGFVQVSLFIAFIVALTHPGLRCLNASSY